MTQKNIRLIQDILAKNAAEHPGKTALVCGKQRLTYAELDERSNRLANALIHNGVRAGDRVLFYLLNGVELVTGIFAALKANAVFVAVDYANAFETVQRIAADCEAALFVTEKPQAEVATRLMQETPSLRRALVVGLEASQPESRLSSFEEIQTGQPATLPPSQVIDRDIAFLLYTSGSTGKPKGVMVTHRSGLYSIESGIEYFRLQENDIHVSSLHLSFSAGINQLLQIFRVGGTLILEKSFAFPTQVFKRMAAERATGFASVPTILAHVLKMDLSRYDLSHLRYMTSVGAALAPVVIQQLREKFPGVLLFSFYGMAEAAYALGLEPEQLEQRPDSVGRPFPGTQAWVAGESGQPLAPNETGELILRGSHVRNGYWNNAEESGKRFKPGPLPGELICATGDLFRTDDEGYFYFVGRNDDIIKSGAKKIAPKEIEDVLYGIEGILEAAVIGVPDPLLGQVVKAFVALDKQKQVPLSAQDIFKCCQQLLESYKVPREVEIRDSLPKTPSGKIKKTDLQS